MSKLDLFFKIQKDIRATLLGLLVFFAAILCGASGYLLTERNEQVETLIVRQVDSLAASHVMQQDLLAIQQELSRFVDSLKASLPYNIEVSVSLAGQLVAGDGNIDGSPILSTRIEKISTLPSGEQLSVAVRVDNWQAILKSLGSLILMALSGFVVYRFLISRLEKSFDLETRPIREQLDKAIALEHRSEIAEQVAHDIRSPLTALDLAVKEINVTPEEKTLLLKSIARMNDVLNDLTSDNGGDVAMPTQEPQSLTSESLALVISDILEEKSARTKSRSDLVLKFSNPPSPIVARVNRKELSRALSNIVDNALDAMPSHGEISVMLKVENGVAIIQISDTGRGIEKEKLSEIGVRGATFGKNGGKGLGIFHAKETMQAFGGKLEIASTVGVGTTVRLSIPIFDTQAEIQNEIILKPNQRLVVIDDDSLIHQVWKMKTSGIGLELLGFTSTENFEAAVTPDLIEGSFFVVDYEFKGKEKSGVKLIAEYELQDRAILVSGRSDQPEIALECEYFGIKRFPKEAIENLKINFRGVNNRTSDLKGFKIERS